MKVYDILQTKANAVTSVNPAELISVVAERFRQENVGAMIVSDNEGSLDGIVTERDVVHALAVYGRKLLDLPVSTLMTTAVATCSPEDNITEISKIMTERHLGHIPVRVGGRFINVISLGDVLEQRIADRRRVARAMFGMTSALH